MLTKTAVLLFLAVTLSGCGSGVPEEEVVARVGDTVLSIDDMRTGMALMGMTEDRESEFVERWINKELLYQEARRQKHDAPSPELEWELELVRKEHAIQKLLDRTYQVKVQVTEEEIQSYYDKNKELFTVAEGEEQVRALHILTQTREDANTALQEISAGKPFEEVARARSTDILKDQGGDMGFFKPDDVIPEISRIAFRLGEGRMSQIFSSKHGFHLLKVIKKYTAGSIRDLADVRNEILQRLRIRKEGAAYYELLYRLEKEVKVTRRMPKVQENGQSERSNPE